MTYDYLVIGAGLSGLTASAILAKHGCRVALVEKAGKTAPLVRGFSRKGVFFDTGFHYTGGLDEHEILDTFFKYLGIASSLEKEPFDEEGFDVFRCSKSGFVFPFPYGADRIRRSFERHFPEEAEAVGGYMRAVSRTYDALPYANLDAPLTDQTLGDPSRGESLQSRLDSLTDKSLLKCILSMHCLLHGVSPQDVSFGAHARVVASYYNSVHRIKGGGKSLVDALDDRCRAWGVDVFTGRAVKEVAFSSAGDLAGARLEDGEEIPAACCISTVHPQYLLSMVPDRFFRPIYRKRLAAFEETSSAYLLFGTTDVVMEDLVGRNQFIFAREAFPGLDDSVPFAERPLYLTAAGEGDERGRAFMALCPASFSEVAHWSKSTTGHRGPAYVAHKQEIAESLLGRIETFYPGFSGHVVFAESATPLTLRDFGNNPLGSLYGVKHRIDQYDLMPVTRVRKLLLAGQALTAPGALGTMISAFLACGAILGHEHLREELRKCV
ncbi:MAG: NAD(P)/FAD-dependent oxidoreductase [Syntrophorhabdales bacterium]|jgi:all-trans-retinol 13,14-reductase